MTGPEQDAARSSAPDVVLRPAVRLGDALLVDALAALAAADSRADVAAAALPLLLEEQGVRACCVVGRDGDRVVVLGSAGYDCGTMAPGAVLPLDSGLPVTEAVRTGRLVERGTGPAWVAVPFGGSRRAGALLLSLTAAPPSAVEDVARLHRLARALGEALGRASAQERTVADLALVTASLAFGVESRLPDVAVRSLPHDGLVGGDVPLVLPDGRGGTWLVLADVCGSGLTAAVLARTVHATVTAVAPYVTSSGDLLRAVERAVQPVTAPGSFVTAVVGHVAAGRLEVSSAGHPGPVLVTAGGVVVPAVVTGQPLALETGPAALPDATVVRVSPGDVVLLHSDGLTDRRTAAGVRCGEAADLLTGPLPDELDRLADHLLRAAEGIGAAVDDTSLLLVRVTS